MTLNKKNMEIKLKAKTQFDAILEKIAFLFERYSLERRTMTQPYLLDVFQKSMTGYKYNPNDELIRETLMEHVGSTPVTAVALFPYINDPLVNLGDSLIMLAIHDIGELEVGDVHTFLKNENNKKQEYDAAIKLLDPLYHPIYHDVENQKSQSAKYAKAIDKITPEIFDYLCQPNITAERFSKFVNIDKDQIVPAIVQHDRPYMLWNPFMTKFHDFLMDRLADKLSKV